MLINLDIHLGPSGHAGTNMSKRKITNALALCLLSGILFSLGGCISTSIKDIAITSLEEVDYHDQKEMPTPSASGLGFLTDSQIVRYKLGNPYEDRPHRPLIKVKFTSHKNLIKYAKDEGYNIGVWPFFCERPDETVYMTNTDVYREGVRVDDKGAVTNPREEAGPIDYYFFLRVARRAAPSSSASDVSYDLREKAEEVCFYLAGGNAPFGFKSKVLTIPKSLISAALRAHPDSMGRARTK